MSLKQSPTRTLKPGYQTADGIVTTRRGRWRNASSPLMPSDLSTTIHHHLRQVYLEQVKMNISETYN